MSVTTVREEILAVVGKHGPATISDLLDLLARDIARDGAADLQAVRKLVAEGAIPLLPVVRDSWVDKILPRSSRPFALVRALASEAPVRALAFIVVMNLLCWVLVVLTSMHPVIVATRVAVLAPGFLFVPGFALVAAWYPYPARGPRGVAGNVPARANGQVAPGSPWILARIAYATCYSVALVVLFGFLLAMVGARLDPRVLLACLTLVEAVASLSILRRVARAFDPYNAL